MSMVALVEGSTLGIVVGAVVARVVSVVAAVGVVVGTVVFLLGSWLVQPQPVNSAAVRTRTSTKVAYFLCFYLQMNLASNVLFPVCRGLRW